MRKHVRDSYCEMAQYIDNNFICKFSGEICKQGDLPNQYECYTYDREIKNYRKGIKTA